MWNWNKSVALEMDRKTEWETCLKTVEFVGSQHMGVNGKKGEDDDVLVESERYLERWWKHWDQEYRASLVAQSLRIHLPMQGTQVRALVREDPTCRGATKTMHHSYWACALEPVSHNYWSLRATTTEACAPRVRAPQQEKPLQWEARAPQRRVAPARRN